VGFIFAPASPRRVSIAAAKRAAAGLPASVLRVGVFFEQDEEAIRRTQREAGLDLLQLHGAGSVRLCRALGEERCIEAVSLQDPSGLAAARRRKAEYLLIDRPRSGKTASPTAAVDWTLAAGLARTRPKTLLAGALSPDNVGDAIRRVRPWGVDASSGLEISPGVKDPGLIRGFFAAVRQADERRGSER